MSNQNDLIVPLCFTVPGGGDEELDLTIGGNLRFMPRHCAVGQWPVLAVASGKRSQTYFAHDGWLWRKADPQREAVQTSQGLTLRSETIGIPFLRPDWADFDFIRPPAEVLCLPSWRKELARVERKLADEIVACGDDLYVRCVPKIVVRWPRQTTSKPTISFVENGAAEDPESTCFSPARLQAAQSFVAANREVPDRPALRIDVLGALDPADEDDVGVFASATKAWLIDKLDDPDPATALLRHGYGLLPTDVLEYLETVRGLDRDPERSMDAVVRIHTALSQDGTDDLPAGSADRARQLGRRLARLTRLAARRWSYECSLRAALAPEDSDALGELAEP